MTPLEKLSRERFILDTGQRYTSERQMMLAAKLLADHRRKAVKVYDHNEKKFFLIQPPRRKQVRS